MLKVIYGYVKITITRVEKYNISLHNISLNIKVKMIIYKYGDWGKLIGLNLNKCAN